MKLVLVLSVLLFCVSYSEQKSIYYNCPEDHETLFNAKIRDGCYKVLCLPKMYGSEQIFGCPRIYVSCSHDGTQIEYKEINNTLTFPDCCGRPLCVKS